MNLQPVDFKAVAAKGRFVYCYLRAKTSKNGKAGTPYYVGVASTAARPRASHVCSVPPIGQRQRIRVLRSGLTWEGACEWEKFYIKHFGRIDLGTGILQNLTEGGDGVKGHGPATLEKMRMAHLGKPLTAEHSENRRQAHLALNRKCTEKQKQQIKKALIGHEVSEETRNKISETKKNRRQEKLQLEADSLGIPLLELIKRKELERKAKKSALNKYFSAKYKAERTPEQKAELSAKKRAYHQRRKATISPEALEAKRAYNREYSRLRRAALKAA